VLVGCSPPPATPTPTPEVTQPAVTSTPTELTDTPPPGLTITPIVLAEVIPSPTPACEAAPPTRMIVGERGQVTDEDPRPLNVRSGPGTEFRILGRLEMREVFLILDGPECGGSFVWYRVRRGNLEGWIAEGDFGSYYIEPYLS
jgi:hypothetical protein